MVLLWLQLQGPGDFIVAIMDRATVDQVNRLLAQTGERERLKDMLRAKLMECGWSDRVQSECYSKLARVEARNDLFL